MAYLVPLVIGSSHRAVKCCIRRLAQATSVFRGTSPIFTLGDVTATVAPDLAGHVDGLQGLTAGDFANVFRQRILLSETLAPEQFLRHLATECRLRADGRQFA